MRKVQFYAHCTKVDQLRRIIIRPSPNTATRPSSHFTHIHKTHVLQVAHRSSGDKKSLSSRASTTIVHSPTDPHLVSDQLRSFTTSAPFTTAYRYIPCIQSHESHGILSTTLSRNALAMLFPYIPSVNSVDRHSRLYTL